MENTAAVEFEQLGQSKDIKKDAVTMVKSLFDNPEQLEKLELYLEKETKKEKKNEEALQGMIRSHVDNLKCTIKELQLALKEAESLQSQINEVHSLTADYAKVEKKLEKLTACSHSAASTVQAIGILNQLIDMSTTVANTKQLLEDMQLLKVHKNLRDLENVRDKILSKHADTAGGSAERVLLNKNFEPVAVLSDLLFEKIGFVLKQLVRLCDDDPSLVVSAIRIIEREEVVDEYWRKAQAGHRETVGGYMPPGRPKRWASHIDSMLVDSFKERIQQVKASLDFADDKLALTEYLEEIRQLAYNHVLCIQNNGIRCFPPSYKILERVVLLYHSVISEVVNGVVVRWDEQPREVDVVAVLLFEKEYFGEQLFGSKNFDAAVLRVLNNSRPLLEEELLLRVQSEYHQIVLLELSSKVDRIIQIEKRHMESSTCPKIVGNVYRTLTSTFYDDFVGIKIKNARALSTITFDKVLQSCNAAFGQFVSRYCKLFDDYRSSHIGSDKDSAHSTVSLANLQSLFKHDKVGQDATNSGGESFPYFVDYTIAVANNCVVIKSALQRLYKEISDEVNSRSVNVKGCDTATCFTLMKNVDESCGHSDKAIDELVSKCFSTAIYDYFMELRASFNEFLSSKWRQDALLWSQGLISSLQGFTELATYIDTNFTDVFMAQLDRTLALQYLTAFLTSKVKFKPDEVGKYGQFIYQDGRQLASILAGKRKLKSEQTYCYAIEMCASIFKNPDMDCALIDVANLFRLYSDFTPIHGIALLSKRQGLSKDVILETVNAVHSSRKTRQEALQGVFCEIKLN